MTATGLSLGSTVDDHERGQSKPGLFDLTGHVAVITGATSGLGLAIAKAMALNGAKLVISGLPATDPDEIAAEFRRSGTQAIGIACDLSKAPEIEQMVLQSLVRFGRIDTLVANAGVQGPAGPLSDVTDEDWDYVMEVNVRAAARLTARVIPAMADRGQGSVILTSSIAGIRGNKAIGLYGLSKAALAQLARNLAVEWGPRGVRVNAISPGLIATPFSQALLGNEAFMARRLSLTPLRRVGEPEEVAGVAVMLASRAGGFITGQNIVVDGGTTISDGN